MDNADPNDKKGNEEQVLTILLAEYGALKSEQLGRIGFRDNLLYVTVGAVGAIGAVALGGLGENKKEMLEAFLLVPWVTTILGWTYLVNDDKITAIRQYVDTDLAKRIQKLMQTKNHPFVWEHFHRADSGRARRKNFQLAIDLITFVVSGLGALAFFVLRQKDPDSRAYIFAGVEVLLLVFLSYQFVVHGRQARRSSANLGDGAA